MPGRGSLDEKPGLNEVASRGAAGRSSSRRASPSCRELEGRGIRSVPADPFFSRTA